MKVSFIGAGRMAHQLGRAIFQSGHQIVQVYNRSADRGHGLSSQLEATYVDNLVDLDEPTDVLIIAVSDDVIATIAAMLSVERFADTIVVHTSGSVNLGVLDRFVEYGSFYPFQSMTIGQDLDFTKVPTLINASSDQGLEKLESLAYDLSEKVYKVSDDQRGQIHLAGVFCNNFTNHMFTIAKDLLTQNGLEFDILKPLISNTLSKIIEIDPIDAQTGPALRNDQDVIERHLQKLERDTHTKAIYELITHSIQRRHEI